MKQTIKLYFSLSVLLFSGIAIIQEALDIHGFDFEKLRTSIPFARDVATGSLHGFETNGKIYNNFLVLFEGSRDKLELKDDSCLKLPFRIKIKLFESMSSSFRIYFARSPQGMFFISASRDWTEKNGIFIESGKNDIRKVCLFPEARELLSSESFTRIAIDAAEKGFTVSINGKEFPLSLSLQNMQYIFQVMTIPPANFTFIDMVSVECAATDTDKEKYLKVAGAEFKNTFFTLDMLELLGLTRDSRGFRIFTFFTAALEVVAIDLLLLLVFRFIPFLSVTPAAFIFMMFPVQAAMLLYTRAALRLTYYPVFFCIGIEALLKFTLLAYQGVKSDVRIKITKKQKLFLILAGFFIYVIIINSIYGIPFRNAKFDYLFLLFIVAFPLTLFFAGLIFIPEYSAEIFILPTLQYFVFFIFPHGFTTAQKMLACSFAFFPFVAASGVDVLKNAKNRVFVFIFIILELLTIFGFLEIGLRGIPFTDYFFAIRHQLGIYGFTGDYWDVVEDVYFTKDRSKFDLVSIRAKLYTRKKDPGTYRIICLGSSSTAGSGCSRETVYSFPAQLETILNSNSSVRTEVINGGVPGVPFYLLEVFLENILLDMEPDLIIIYFGVNRDREDSREFHEQIKRELMEAPEISTREELWMALHLKYNPWWMLKSIMYLSKYRCFLAPLVIKNLFVQEPLLDMKQHSQEMLSKSMEDAVVSIINKKVKVLLVPEICRLDIISNREKNFLSHEYYYIFEMLADKYSNSQVFYEDLRSRYSPDLAYSHLLDDVHMNDSGYRYLAEQIADVIYKNGFLKKGKWEKDYDAIFSLQ